MSKGSIEDWAAKCARYIKSEPRSATEGRIAAIIETFAEPLMKVLRESRREHIHLFGGTFYCCSACPQHENDVEKGPIGKCDCGADEYNAKVDKALYGPR